MPPPLGGCTGFCHPPPPLRMPPCFTGGEADFAARWSLIAVYVLMGVGRCGGLLLRLRTRRLRVCLRRLDLFLPATALRKVIVVAAALIRRIVSHWFVFNREAPPLGGAYPLGGYGSRRLMVFESRICPSGRWMMTSPPPGVRFKSSVAAA